MPTSCVIDVGLFAAAAALAGNFGPFSARCLLRARSVSKNPLLDLLAEEDPWKSSSSSSTKLSFLSLRTAGRMEELSAWKKNGGLGSATKRKNQFALKFVAGGISLGWLS
jgi:hypothetical protein